jgi:hypothetical protein
MIPLAASADWESSRSSAFEAMVLTSRFSSWIRKSSGRPTEPPRSSSSASCWVRAEPRQLFPDVGLLGPDRDLGEDPALVEHDVAEQGTDALA